jgi:hypothetical protein
MIIMKQIHPIVVLLLLFLIGCGETVTNHYPTRAAAEADRLFDRGWLPSLIPATATAITTSNDLDHSTSRGEFSCAARDTVAFIGVLKKYSGQKAPFPGFSEYVTEQKAGGYDAYEYSNAQAIWIFFVNSRTGHVRYAMYERKI